MSATTNIFFNIREVCDEDGNVLDAFVATAKRGGEDTPFCETEEVEGKFTVPGIGSLVLKQNHVLMDNGSRIPLKFTSAGTPFVTINSVGDRAKHMLMSRPK